LASQPSLADLVLRYLRAFGPASVLDMQVWSGLTRLREVVEPMRRDLVVVHDPSGRELFDLPDAPRPDPDTSAPVRLLAEFDNVLLGHADRSRILPEQFFRRLFTINGRILGGLLVDGTVVGGWRLARSKGAAVLTIQPFLRLSTVDAEAAEAEGQRLLEFVAGPADTREVRLAAPADD
jgi:hypothetical protein